MQRTSNNRSLHVDTKPPSPFTPIAASTKVELGSITMAEAVIALYLHALAKGYSYGSAAFHDLKDKVNIIRLEFEDDEPVYFDSFEGTTPAFPKRDLQVALTANESKFDASDYDTLYGVGAAAAAINKMQTLKNSQAGLPTAPMTRAAFGVPLSPIVVPDRNSISVSSSSSPSPSSFFGYAKRPSLRTMFPSRGTSTSPGASSIRSGTTSPYFIASENSPRSNALSLSTSEPATPALPLTVSPASGQLAAAAPQRKSSGVLPQIAQIVQRTGWKRASPSKP